MKPVQGIQRVTLKRSKNVLFAITKPDVFKAPSSDTYIIFGEAKIEDLTQAAQSQAASQFKGPNQAAVPAPAASAASVGSFYFPSSLCHCSLWSYLQLPSSVCSQGAEEDEGPVDETGVDPKDIELVINQTSCSRAKAVTALKNSDNDIVNAIMELTM